MARDSHAAAFAVPAKTTDDRHLSAARRAQVRNRFLRRVVSHASMPAAGFVDPWSARAGSRVALHLSSADRHPSVSVMRLDLEPIAPTGWTPNVLAESIEPGSFEQGSWLEVPDSDGEDESSFDALDVEFLLTGTKGTRTLVA